MEFGELKSLTEVLISTDKCWSRKPRTTNLYYDGSTGISQGLYSLDTNSAPGPDFLGVFREG